MKISSKLMVMVMEIAISIFSLFAQQPELVVQQGHSISSADFSSDGQYIITASSNDAKLWDVATGMEVRTYYGELDEFAIFNQDSKYFIAGSRDKVKLLDVSDGKEIRIFQGYSGKITSVAFSPDNSYVLIGCDDKIARLWDITTRKVIRSFNGHSAEILSVAFSPDGRLVLTCSRDETAKLWNVAKGIEIHTFRGHSSGISSATFSKGGHYIITGDFDGNVNKWDTMTGILVLSFKGHSNPINALAVSPDNRYVLTGGFEKKKSIKLWDLTTGKELRTFEGHSDEVLSVAFSPDGRYMLSGSFDETVKLWDTNSGKKIRTFRGKKAQSNEQQVIRGEKLVRTFDDSCSGWISSVSFTPDGLHVLTTSYNCPATLWDLKTGKVIRTFWAPFNQPECAALSSNGHNLATGTSDGRLILWNTSTGEKIATLFQGHLSSIRSAAFSPDFRYIITGSDDEMAKLWDVSSGMEIRTFEGHTGMVQSVAFSPDGNFVLTGSADSTVKLWNTSSAMEIRTLKCNAWSVAFSPDGKYVLTGGSDKTAKLWNVATGQEIRKFEGHSGGIRAVAFSPDGNYILTGAIFPDFSAKLWNTITGKEIRTFLGHDDRIVSVSFSPDGRYVLTASEDGIAKLWDFATGINIRNFCGHAGSGNTVTLSPDGRYMFTNGGQSARLWDLSMGIMKVAYPWTCSTIAFSADGHYILIDNLDNIAKLCDVSDGKEIRKFVGHSGEISSVAFSPNGQYALTGSIDESAKLWDISTGKEIRTYQVDSGHGSPVAAVFSPNGKYIMTGCREAKLWDAFTGKENYSVISELQVDSLGSSTTGAITSVAFSPSGQYFVTGALNNIATLWNLQTGEKVRIFQGHSDAITSIAFSPNCRYILTGSHDKTAKLWNASTGMELHTFIGHSRSINAVTFSPDGQSVLTASWDQTDRLWDANTGKEIATFIGIDKSDYVIHTPDNYYLCSKGALQGVAFRIGNRVFPFEQFDLKLNRPDIVMQRIGYAEPALIETYHQAYVRRLRKMGFKEEDLSAEMHLPEVKLDWKSVTASTDQRKVNLNLTAWDDKYLLDRINVFINDVSIFGVRGINLRNQKIQKMERTITLDLNAGVNKIQVSVHNEKGVESLKETVYISYTGPRSKPDLYIVSIGTSEYQNSKYNLGFAAKDASDIISTFNSLTGTRFGTVKALLLTNEKATRENVIAAKQFFNQSRVDDLALLFVAGHGLVDSEYNYYFGAYDVDFQNPALKGLPYEEIDNLLDGIPARKKLLLLDACFSGEIDKTEMQLIAANVSPEVSGSVKMRAFLDKRGIRVKKGLVDNALLLQQDLFADLRRGTGAVVISSSSGDEYSFEGTDWKNGVFTYSLLEGLKLKKADENKDGQIRVSELQKYVMERVKTLTNGGQNPTVRQENLADDFVLY